MQSQYAWRYQACLPSLQTPPPRQLPPRPQGAHSGRRTAAATPCLPAAGAWGSASGPCCTASRGARWPAGQSVGGSTYGPPTPPAHRTGACKAAVGEHGSGKEWRRQQAHVKSRHVMVAAAARQRRRQGTARHGGGGRCSMVQSARQDGSLVGHVAGLSCRPPSGLTPLLSPPASPLPPHMHIMYRESVCGECVPDE